MIVLLTPYTCREVTRAALRLAECVLHHGGDLAVVGVAGRGRPRVDPLWDRLIRRPADSLSLVARASHVVYFDTTPSVRAYGGRAAQAKHVLVATPTTTAGRRHDPRGFDHVVCANRDAHQVLRLVQPGPVERSRVTWCPWAPALAVPTGPPAAGPEVRATVLIPRRPRLSRARLALRLCHRLLRALPHLHLHVRAHAAWAGPLRALWRRVRREGGRRLAFGRLPARQGVQELGLGQDLLLFPCGDDDFTLNVLDALAARLPVVVPSSMPGCGAVRHQLDGLVVSEGPGEPLTHWVDDLVPLLSARPLLDRLRANTRDGRERREAFNQFWGNFLGLL